MYDLLDFKSGFDLKSLESAWNWEDGGFGCIWLGSKHRIMKSELGMLRIEMIWRGCRATIEWGMEEKKEDDEGFDNAPRVVKGW